MINAVAVITGKPGTGDQLEPALRELAAATHGEQGCILYSVQRGLAEPDTFVTVEKWHSQEDLDAHLQTPHVAAAIGAATPLLARELQILATAELDAGDAAKNTF